MNARLIGTGALIAIALIVVPDRDVPVQPVAEIGPESVLCDRAVADTVYPDTFVNRVIGSHHCAQRHAADVLRRVERGLGLGIGESGT